MGNDVIAAIGSGVSASSADLHALVVANLPVILGATAVIAGSLRWGPKLVKRVLRG